MAIESLRIWFSREEAAFCAVALLAMPVSRINKAVQTDLRRTFIGIPLVMGCPGELQLHCLWSDKSSGRVVPCEETKRRSCLYPFAPLKRNKRNAFNVTIAVAPVSANTAIQSPVMPNTVVIRYTPFMPSAKTKFLRIIVTFPYVSVIE